MGVNSRGFTVTELLTVVAIISIVSSIAFPTLMSQVPKFRLNGTVREIAQKMYLARLKSVRNNKEIRMVITNNAYPVQDSYHLEKNSGGWSVVSEEVKLPKDVNIHDVTFPLSRCEFNPDGTSSSGGIYFKIRDEGDTLYRITTTAAVGKINVRRP